MRAGRIADACISGKAVFLLASLLKHSDNYPMRIALFSPFSIGPSRGNITTVNRISRNLSLLGKEVSIIPLDSTDSSQPAKCLNSNPPDLIHAFHAFYTGPAAREYAKKTAIPYIITITGSDLFDPYMNSHPETVSALGKAACVTCFDQVVASETLAAFPFLKEKLIIIPQGVEKLSPASDWPRTDDTFLILMPAAIRPAKGILEAINALEPLKAELPDMRLLLAGGDIDPEYAMEIKTRIEPLDWIETAGDVPHDKMSGLYSASDLVLNCSLFEGGMANSILEAMIMGRPVLARDIPGNRSAVKNGETGWLYSSDEELRRIIIMLAEQPGLRKSAGRAASDLAASCFSPTEEAKAFTSLYSRLLQRT